MGEKRANKKGRQRQTWAPAHQSCAVVAGKVLLTYLNEAPEGLLWDTLVLKQLKRDREDGEFLFSEVPLTSAGMCMSSTAATGA